MTHTLDDLDWRPRAKALAAKLAEDGVLTDRRWKVSIEDTPRHVFVPRFYDDDSVIEDTSPTWLDAVYRDETLVTQKIAVPGITLDLPTSSSTRPSLMTRMLELLAVTDSSRVLEIGTATGYNAALLCHRLGDSQAASIELHPALAADAAEHLHQLGYHPMLAVGDGTAGLPARAPYDRIIATCAISAVPPAWIKQLAPGGRIVADLRNTSSSLVVLDKIDNSTVQGRLLDQPGHFMWLRPKPDSPLPPDDRLLNRVINIDDAHTTPTDIDPAQLDDPGLRHLLGMLEPTLDPPFRIQHDDAHYLGLRTTDGSWANVSLNNEPTTVTQGGPRDLWPTVEHAIVRWQCLGEPGRGRYGVTITTDGIHHYWLDHPDNPIT